MHSLFRRARAPAAAAGAATAPMPMLSFPGKKALCFAGDTSAAERDADLAVLMHSRGRVVALASGSKQPASAAEAADALRVYLRHIYASQMRGASRHQLLRFAWRDAAGGGSKKKAPKAAAAAGHTSLAAEQAVALFALAAELARAAAAEDRRGAYGIRRACKALADAAGALSAAAAVKGCSSAQEATGLCHMTDACLAAFQRLMLAQALECYFELAVAGGSSPALCAKIAQQVSLDYQQVSIALESLHQEQQPIDKSWRPHVQAKAAYFHAEACRLLARPPRVAGCVGEAVARLRHALSAVLDGAGVKAATRKSEAPVRAAVARLRREVEAELADAVKDNVQVFMERVPAADALPALPGLTAPLVRPSALEKVLREDGGEEAL